MRLHESRIDTLLAESEDVDFWQSGGAKVWSVGQRMHRKVGSLKRTRAILHITSKLPMKDLRDLKDFANNTVTALGGGGPVVSFLLQGFIAHKKQPPPLGPP